jgi:SAM-dependent methyltransferase
VGTNGYKFEVYIMNETKFDGMGEIYSKYRPTYPIEFINFLYTNIGITKDNVIADIGSGTGILTKQLLVLGNIVYAVEPNQDMRIKAEIDLCEFSNFISINGTAENTTLNTKSVNYITVAQAFHWFDRKKFKTECQRILKAEGKVILVWNSRDLNADVVLETDKIHRAYCSNFKGFSGGMRGEESEGYFNGFFTGEYKTYIFQNNLSFNLDGFIGRNLSASYALKKDDDKYDDYVTELTKCFSKYSVNGTLIMPNITKCYIGII